MWKILPACVLSVCATTTMAAEPVWTPVTPSSPPVEFRPVPAPTQPSPSFVPVEDMNRVYPRKMSDHVDVVMVVQVILLALAVDNLPSRSAGTTPRPRP